MNYIDLFVSKVQKNGSKPAVVDRNGSRKTTYRELDRLSSQISGKVKALGCTEGDYVVIYMDNCVEYIAAYLGVLKAGCAVVPLAKVYPQSRVDYIVADCKAKLVIGQGFFNDIEQYGEYYAPAEDESPAYVVYTSGSTGNPKGICHTVHDIYACAVRLTEDLFKDCCGYRRAAFAQISFAVSFVEIFANLLIENSIYIIPEEAKSSPGQLVDFLNANAIDAVFIPPSFLRAINENSICLKRIDASGEALGNVYFEKTPIYNLYGQSEMSTVTCFPVDQAYGLTPIGKPLKGLTTYVLDKNGAETADGMTGELCIEGDFGVSYINDPQKTAETFIKLKNGNTLIHTGDNVFKNENGDIVYVSRKDWMVKINGQRVETMEVERKLNDIDGVAVSAVKAWTDKDGQTYLAGYYQPDGTHMGGAVTEDLILEELGRTLPEYMIPRFLIRMEELPRNINGKLDRRALPEPMIDDYKKDYAAPTTETQKQLCRSFENVLRCGRVGINDSFFALGGDSIKVMKLLGDASITGLTAAMILEGKTPDGIAALIEENGNEAAKPAPGASAPEICCLMESQPGVNMECSGSQQPVKSCTPVLDDYPLTRTQEGIAAESIVNLGTTIYNIPYLIHMGNSVNALRLVEALKKTVNAHPFLKASLFTDENAKIRAKRRDDAEPTVTFIEGEEPDTEKLIRPFDLFSDELYRLFVYHNADGCTLFADFHHIVFDGTSLAVFFADLNRAYAGEELEKESYTGFDAALDEEAALASNAYEKAKEYYHSVLDNCDTENLPMRDSKTAEPGAGNVSMDLLISRRGIEKICRRYGVSENALFNSAFGYTLCSFTGKDDTVYATIYNGRNDSRKANTVSMYVKTLPIRCALNREQKISEYIQSMWRQYIESMEKDIFSFADVSAEFGIRSDVLFAYQGVEFFPDTLCGEPFSLQSFGSDTAKAAMLVQVFPEQDGYRLSIEYRKKLYSEELMRSILESMAQVIREFTEKTELSEIEPCSAKQLEKLDSFNPSQYPDYIGEETIVSLFRASAEKYPDITALVFKDKHYTYRQLDEITDVLSVYIAQAVGRSEKQPVVSILIPRNEYMAIIPLAAQKAGCCFQPLDPSYPKERLNFMVNDADASLVFADPALSEVLTEYSGKTVLTSEIDGILRAGKKAPLPAPAKSEDVFILLYTSGSTGVPKGVVLEQRNFVAYCKWYRDYYHFAPGDSLACYASFGFDVHMSEIYGALTNGYTSHIIPEEIRLDLIEINRYFEENNIVGTFLTTAVGVQFVQNIDSTSLKVLMTAGEKLVSLDPPADYELINAYGPTEAFVVTVKNVLKNEENIPIGKPLDTVRCYIVDKNMHRLPIGAPGELILAGPQVARGYLNRPEKTAEVFIRDPFASEATDYLNRAYRTGDIVRWRSNGDIEFIGRRDGQIKIHGYRIELKELEAVVRQFASIRDVTVQALDGQGGEKIIVAYVVSDGEVDAEALKQFIADKKPPYMVPAAVVQLDRIPLNTNQKVDRKALPVPELGTEEDPSAEMTADIPLNVLETGLMELASQVLGTERIGLTEKLSRLGLTSISAIRLATLVYKKYGVSLKAAELVSGGTLRMMEDAILTAWMAEKSTPEKSAAQEKSELPKPQEKRPVLCPLSFTQQGVYADCMASPGSTRYNIPYCVAFPEGVHAGELKKALRAVIQAHPSFFLRFTANEKNETVQYYASDDSLEIPVREMSAEEFAGYQAGFVRPFALTDEPLARFEIVQADRLYLLADIHHLISDGASMDIFFRQLCACLDGEAPEKEEYSYFDHVANERITAETEKFFEEQMADCEEATRLIPDIFEEGLSHSEGVVSVKTDLGSVSRFAAENGITPAAVYLAAAYIACSRYVCEDSAAITTISNGRSDLRLHNTLGMFVNTLPLTVKLDNAEGTLSFIKRVAENYAATIAHENYPFARIGQKYDFHPSLSYTYQVGVINTYAVRGGELSLKEMSLDMAKLPCSVYIVGSGEDAGEIQVNYDEALYSESMMKGFAESMENAVQGLMSKNTLREISLTNEAQQKALDGYNRPFDLGYDPTDTAVSLFRKQAAAHPEKTAAVYMDRAYTFRELDALTDRLAEVIYGELSAITGLDSLAEQVVPIITSRNENTFILPLAVLKAGSAYEPLDPDYPAERLRFMVQDAGARLLLAERGLEERVSDFDGKVIFIDELYARLAEPACRRIEDIPASGPGDLLIMLYTSGTTGTPKGVQLEHGNLAAYAYGSAVDGFYTEDSKTAAYASFGFDVNMADTFCTLLNGGTLYVIPQDMRMNLDDLAAYFDEVGITEVLLTTQVGVQFISHYPRMKTLRTLTVGGEKLPAISPDALSYQVNNGYGPTENCCGVSLFPVRFWEPNIPIGKPMATINAFVLDRTGHRLPAGAAGEYCLSGPQVARGYLNRPDKTAEAFEDCPFNGFRMYHTGDIVRYRPNGDVEFVGRKDGQVKIRGFRVELKEIEAVIREFEGIEDVTVQSYDFESGGKYLAAFVVSGGKVDAKQLSEFIKSRKPAYMVPAAISQIKEIPLTVNRKVDKKALPKPELQKAEYIAPQTKAEEDFCRILGEILGIERVSAEEDFFDLGGSSISAMKVVLAAGKAGYEIVYQDVFDAPTPRLLAALAEKEGSADAEEEAVPSPADTESPYGPGTTEIGPDGYDYSGINALLRKNTLDAFRNGERLILGDVLLTGATGYLGIHVLRELINGSDRRIYCLVRSKNGVSGEERLRELLAYYFENDYRELFGKRLFIVEGDATDADTLKTFRPEKEVTVINCAANVSHFAKGDRIERDNMDSVNNLIDWCVAHNARLVHTSTCSVVGSARGNMPPESFRLTEQVLFAGQRIDGNQYIHSKFMGERAVCEAILHRGLSAKIMRMSNLAPRFSDGAFQKNYKTNNFMATLAAYKALGMISYDMMSAPTEFSPIDCVSRAITLLATTPEECTCFMLTNQNLPFLGNVVLQLAEEGAPIRIVENEEMSAAFTAGLNDPAISEKLRPLIAYSSKSSDNQRELGLESLDARYTVQILYRLGYVWPMTDDAYVRRFIRRLNELGYFA